MHEDTSGSWSVFDGNDSGSQNHVKSRNTAGIFLSRVLPSTRFFACDDILVKNCHDDPNRCGPGDVFVARLTAADDGHENVSSAIARGVAGVIAERMVPTFGIPLCLVPDSDWAFARLSHALAGDPAESLRVIAITGTSGKTTTAWLAASILSEAGLCVGVLSDLGCLDAYSTEPVLADISHPQVLAAWLTRLVETGCTHAVVEVSSRMLSQQVLAGMTCDTVAVGNLALAHLEQHNTAGAYQQIKSRILDSLALDGCLIAGADNKRVDKMVQRQAQARPHCAVITAGLLGRADVSATAIERSLHGQTFLLRAGGQMAPVAVTTPVTSFVRDALMAAAIGLRYRVPLERIARGIEAAGSVSGRMEKLDRGQAFCVFLDGPTSGHALSTTLSSLRKLTPGRLVLLVEEQLAVQLVGGEIWERDCVQSKRFESRASRWCDDCMIVPAGMLADDAGQEQVRAYARVDRLLWSLGEQDCLLVLGRGSNISADSPDPLPGGLSLAVAVDGWLKLANPPQQLSAQRSAGRRAA